MTEVRRGQKGVCDSPTLRAEFVVTKFICRLICKVEMSRRAVETGPGKAETHS
jgi:hypothetical protein